MGKVIPKSDLAKAKQIVLTPYAKINLYLKVLGKRKDGYHELLTFIHPIALFDELAITRTKSGFKVNCRAEGLPLGQNIPLPQDNLITKAAALFFEKTGEKPSVEVSLVKRIPIGGGLGGGSSDAAGTLNGLNRLFGCPLSEGVLHEICSSLGMDVSFFLEQSPAICRGRGEIIEKRCKPLDFWCVLINPGKNLPTKDVYKMLTTPHPALSPVGGEEKKIFPLPSGERTCEARVRGQRQNLTLTGRETTDNILRFGGGIDKFVDYIENDLEVPAVKLCPEIGDCKDMLRSAGALASFVCGSGSTVCGITKTKNEAEEVAKRVKGKAGESWWIKVVSSL